MRAEQASWDARQANCRSDSTRAVSPASAFRASTAASVWTHAYQRAFDAEARCYEMPLILNVPTFTICAATILDMGSEEQKRDHISAAIRGDEILVQLLPRTQRRIRPRRCDHPGRPRRRQVGDQRRQDLEHQRVRRRLRAAAGPHRLDRAQARGPDDVPGAAQRPGITMRRIKEVNGSEEFCEEFFDSLELGDDAVVGEVNNGWEVASRQLFHERRAVGGGSEFASGTGAENAR